MGTTVYYITDNNADGKVCFLNKNTACFQEIFQPYDKNNFVNGYHEIVPHDYKLTSFFPGKQIHVFVTKDISLNLAKIFIHRLSTIFGKYSIQKIEDDFKLWETYKVYNKQVSDHSGDYEYKIVVNVDDFETLNHFKYAMYMLRPLFEATSLINRLTQPEIPEGLDFWQWMRIVWSQSYCNHNYFNLNYYKGTSVIKNFPKEEFFDKHFTTTPFEELGRFAQIHKRDHFMLGLGDTIESASQKATEEYRAALQRLPEAAKKIQIKLKPKTKSNV